MTDSKSSPHLTEADLRRIVDESRTSGLSQRSVADILKAAKIAAKEQGRLKGQEPL